MKIVDGNKACAEAAYNFTEIASIYPITPSSPMASEMDALSNIDTKNIFDDKVKLIEMNSESGAAGTMHGALISGSLSTTFTASQGLLLMIPNMYKMAGECLPGVIHVAARTIATHALSIFGDHSDIYATRQTGFCMLASTNVQDAYALSLVAHLSAIKGSLPFVHFFDGFRTSHEINKINVLDRKKILKLVDWDKIQEFKNRALNVDKCIERGLALNEDIYFQGLEARNTIYNAMPNIVNEEMTKVNKLLGTNYKPFNYYGSASAKHVIIAMGSVCDTIKLTIDSLKNNDLGLIEVHLYRPFSQEYLLKVLPKSVQNIAVLDRTKESGSIGEPLYLDIVAALKDKDINIVGGRYGISSKNTTPEDINAIFNMLNNELKNNFTIGINDDVTNLSLSPIPFDYKLDTKEIKIFGFGSDGMVSASKDIIKIIGEECDKYIQSYNQYDSKKSGGVTICNLRISNSPINAPFYVQNPDLVVVTKEDYLSRFNILEGIKENGTLLINTIEKDVNKILPNKLKNIIKEKNIKVMYINAYKIATEANISGKISKIMETVILKLLDIKNYDKLVSDSIVRQFKNKGEEIVSANQIAIEDAVNNLFIYNKELINNNEIEEEKNNIFDYISSLEGNTLPVSSLLPYKDGCFPGALSTSEKSVTNEIVPHWISEKCIKCGLCSFVCPHGVIRPYIENGEFKIKIYASKCTGCGLCVSICPTASLEFGPYDEKENIEAKKYFDNFENDKELQNKNNIKGLSLIKPKFNFSGACAGCGEANYIKILTQLLEDKLIIANATGCSSIYGGSLPSTPYSISWANSLFEDNAEFGFGMLMSYNNIRQRIKNYVEENIDTFSGYKKLLKEWLNNFDDFDITYRIKKDLLKVKKLDKFIKDNIDYIPARSVWTIGGDGWAYDIGFGGLDHVLSSNKKARILVLDTEVYSNTGGQMSKSSRIGAVAEFANLGKQTVKKDLFRIAICYPNCYVANISLGANYMQTINAFKEAEANDGPSIIIAYSPCIEQGIKGGMINSIKEQKLAVECGYINLMRYKDNRLYLDSKEPNFDKYEEFLMNEVRYNSLVRKNKEYAEYLLEINKKEAEKRYEYYKSISEKD